ncbi:hypothetical protein BB561_001495 [Smittium simulii]|uniref:BRCT domain-containing protein n=1 Tax=Smittium simulii TaxID=133385 RepID=A0A2T9YUF3_9FUNG|nr:hypothetical protein BB561_001495 [Smittium simulii]
MNNNPISSYKPLSKKNFCTSGFQKKYRDIIHKSIKDLGGSFEDNLTKNVDILIANNSLTSEKCRAASMSKIPIVKESFLNEFQQIYDVFKKRASNRVSNVCFSSDDFCESSFFADCETLLAECIEKNILGVFEGCLVCVTGFTREERDKLKIIIEKNLGKYTPNLYAGCTHLIAKYPSGTKYTYALYKHIPVVSIDWIEESLKLGVVANELDFVLEDVDRKAQSNPLIFNQTPKKFEINGALSLNLSNNQINNSQIVKDSKKLSKNNILVTESDLTLPTIHKNNKLRSSQIMIAVNSEEFSTLDIQTWKFFLLKKRQIFTSFSDKLDLVEKIQSYSGRKIYLIIKSGIKLSAKIYEEVFDLYTKTKNKFEMCVLWDTWLSRSINMDFFVEIDPHKVSKNVFEEYFYSNNLNESDYKDFLTHVVTENSINTRQLDQNFSGSEHFLNSNNNHIQPNISVQKSYNNSQASNLKQLTSNIDFSVSKPSNQNFIGLNLNMSTFNSSDKNESLENNKTHFENHLKNKKNSDNCVDISESNLHNEKNLTQNLKKTQLFRGCLFISIGWNKNEESLILKLVEEQTGILMHLTDLVNHDISNLFENEFNDSSECKLDKKVIDIIEKTASAIQKRFEEYGSHSSHSFIDNYSPEQVLFHPLDVNKTKLLEKKWLFSISGYEGLERDHIGRLCLCLGFDFCETFSKNTTHLICKPPFSGPKYRRALKWKIVVVGADAFYHLAQLLQSTHEISPNKNSLSFNANIDQIKSCDSTPMIDFTMELKHHPELKSVQKNDLVLNSQTKPNFISKLEPESKSILQSGIKTYLKSKHTPEINLENDQLINSKFEFTHKPENLKKNESKPELQTSTEFRLENESDVEFLQQSNFELPSESKSELPLEIKPELHMISKINLESTLKPLIENSTDHTFSHNKDYSSNLPLLEIPSFSPIYKMDYKDICLYDFDDISLKSNFKKSSPENNATMGQSEESKNDDIVQIKASNNDNSSRVKPTAAKTPNMPDFPVKILENKSKTKDHFAITPLNNDFKESYNEPINNDIDMDIDLDDTSPLIKNNFESGFNTKFLNLNQDSASKNFNLTNKKIFSKILNKNNSNLRLVSPLAGQHSIVGSLLYGTPGMTPLGSTLEFTIDEAIKNAERGFTRFEPPSTLQQKSTLWFSSKDDVAVNNTQKNIRYNHETPTKANLGLNTLGENFLNNLQATKEVLNIKSLPLYGLTICISPILISMKTELEHIAEQLGASVVDFTAATTKSGLEVGKPPMATHLVHSSNKKKDYSSGLRWAKRNNVFVVSHYWLYSCNKSGSRLSELAFVPTYKPDNLLLVPSSSIAHLHNENLTLKNKPKIKTSSPLLDLDFQKSVKVNKLTKSNVVLSHTSIRAHNNTKEPQKSQSFKKLRKSTIDKRELDFESENQKENSAVKKTNYNLDDIKSMDSKFTINPLYNHFETQQFIETQEIFNFDKDTNLTHNNNQKSLMEVNYSSIKSYKNPQLSNLNSDLNTSTVQKNIAKEFFSDIDITKADSKSIKESWIKAIDELKEQSKLQSNISPFQLNNELFLGNTDFPDRNINIFNISKLKTTSENNSPVSDLETQIFSNAGRGKSIKPNRWSNVLLPSQIGSKK